VQCSTVPCRKCSNLVDKICNNPSLSLHNDLCNPPAVRLTSRRPVWSRVNRDIDAVSRWREELSLADVNNHSLIDDPNSIYVSLASTCHYRLGVSSRSRVCSITSVNECVDQLVDESIIQSMNNLRARSHARPYCSATVPVCRQLRLAKKYYVEYTTCYIYRNR